MEWSYDAYKWGTGENNSAGLTIKAPKCHVGENEIKYSVSLVGSGHIKPVESKVEDIKNWPISSFKKKTFKKDRIL